jgi:hypothetical protein
MQNTKTKDNGTNKDKATETKTNTDTDTKTKTHTKTKRQTPIQTRRQRQRQRQRQTQIQTPRQKDTNKDNSLTFFHSLNVFSADPDHALQNYSRNGKVLGLGSWLGFMVRVRIGLELGLGLGFMVNVKTTKNISQDELVYLSLPETPSGK